MIIYYEKQQTLTTSSTGSSNISEPSSCSPLVASCWHSENGGGGVDERLELLLLQTQKEKKNENLIIYLEIRIIYSCLKLIFNREPSKQNYFYKNLINFCFLEILFSVQIKFRLLNIYQSPVTNVVKMDLY